MPLVEKQLADDLVKLRHSNELAGGDLKVPASSLERALQHHLDREQEWRAAIATHMAVTS